MYLSDRGRFLNCSVQMAVVGRGEGGSGRVSTFLPLGQQNNRTEQEQDGQRDEQTDRRTIRRTGRRTDGRRKGHKLQELHELQE